jgi:predicted ferric reductase
MLDPGQAAVTSSLGTRARIGGAPGSVAAARGSAQLVRRWLAGLAVVLLAPLALRVLAGGPAPLWATLTDLTGLFTLSAMVCTIVLVCRLRALSRATGITALHAAHRGLGILAAGSLVLHIGVVIAADLDNLRLLTWAGTPPRARAATAAAVAIAGVIALGVLRRRVGQDYELWRWAHRALSLAAMALSVLHVLLVGELVRHPVLRWVLVALAVALAAGLAHRLLAARRSSEHVVREVRHDSDSVCTLVLDPREAPLRFAPGQFAWLRLERTGEDHPFTIASSAAGGGCAFTVRSTGDFGSRLRNLPPGAPVWVDGPYGSCSLDLLTQPASGVAMIATGVGITPMLSMVRTLADRHDPRPLLLVQAAREPRELLFRGELAQLANRLDLTVVEVVRDPSPDWIGATGDVATPLLRSVLPHPGQRSALDYFVCGPPGFVTDVARSLLGLGVPEHRIHIEQF